MMDIILKKLESIESRICLIENSIEQLKDNGEKMNSHITFIEMVYDSVKSPFYYLMNFTQTRLQGSNLHFKIK